MDVNAFAVSGAVTAVVVAIIAIASAVQAREVADFAKRKIAELEAQAKVRAQAVLDIIDTDRRRARDHVDRLGAAVLDCLHAGDRNFAMLGEGFDEAETRLDELEDTVDDHEGALDATLEAMTVLRDFLRGYGNPSDVQHGATFVARLRKALEQPAVRETLRGALTEELALAPGTLIEGPALATTDDVDKLGDELDKLARRVGDLEQRPRLGISDVVASPAARAAFADVARENSASLDELAALDERVTRLETRVVQAEAPTATQRRARGVDALRATRPKRS